jgi:hypothetical protein
MVYDAEATRRTIEFNSIVPLVASASYTILIIDHIELFLADYVCFLKKAFFPLDSTHKTQYNLFC